VRVFKSAWFCRFCRAHGISDESLLEAVRRADTGQVDVRLGGGVIKQRIARPRQGRSRSYRAIVVFREGYRAFFVYGYAKSDRDNLREDEKAQFRKMADSLFALTDDQLGRLVEGEGFREVRADGEEVSK